MFCKKCGAEIDDNASFCHSCGENQNTPLNNTPNVEVDISHLTNDEKWDMKEKLGKLCSYAMFLTGIGLLLDIFSEYGDLSSLLGSFSGAIISVLNVFIYLKLREYFRSLHSLFTYYIYGYAAVALFTILSDVLVDNEVFAVLFFILMIGWVVYSILLGVKLKKLYKEHSLLGNLFIGYPIVVLAFLLIQAISYVDIAWLILIIGAVMEIVMYRVISKTVKAEIV